MKVGREQMAENRRKILQAAGRLFRAKGFEAVTVADVMKAAGLTHGGFYGHFKSKDDLIAQTLEHVVTHDPESGFDLNRFVASYLSPRHRDDLAGGCPIAALGPEAARHSPETRAALTARLRGQLELYSKSAPGSSAAEKRQAAIGIRAAMLGALILARFSDDPELSEEVLAKTRSWIGKKSGKAAG